MSKRDRTKPTRPTASTSAPATPPARRPEREPSRPSSVLGIGLLVAEALILLGLSWRRWPDVLVDFGRELYVPWRICEGDVLYRDLAYFNGPLAPYVNAGLFRVFGPGLMVLVWMNLVVAVLIATLLFTLLKRIGDRYSATLALFVFTTAFLFAHLTFIGNYNYVCPYSHEATYGIALSLTAIYLMVRYGECGRAGWVVGSGISAGLVALTKPEVFLALVPAIVCGFWRTRGYAKRRVVLSVWVGSLLLPPVLAVGCFSLSMPRDSAVVAVLAGWSNLLNPEILSLPFYRTGMGTDNVPASIGLMAASAAGYVVLFGAAGAVALRRTRRLLWWPIAALVVLCAIWASPDLARPLPLAIVALAAVWRKTLTPARAAMLVFSLLLLGKIILNVRVWHYGFTLAMPAAMLLVVLLTTVAPAVLAGWGGDGVPFRRTATLFLVAFAAVPLFVSFQYWQRCSIPVGVGRDRFLADERGTFVQAAVEAVTNKVSPEETLLVLPEGVMINYLARRRSPSPYINFMPPELLMYGEANMVSALEANPPDFIAVVDKDTSEYGVPRFGRDYGRLIAAWVTAKKYDVVASFGPRPLTGSGFGVWLLKRR